MSSWASDYIVKVSAGPDYDHLTPIQVNDEENPLYINSDDFTGYLLMRILDYDGVNIEMEKDGIKDGTKHYPIQNPASSYFKGRNRRYSMTVQGRFKETYHGDEVVFGIDSSRPLAPITGISMALRISRWLDPTLEADLSGDMPHMYSPIVSGINALGVFDAKNDKVVGKPIGFQSTSHGYLPMSPHSPDTKLGHLQEPLTPTSPERMSLEDRGPVGERKLFVGSTEPLDIQPWAFGSCNVPDNSELIFNNPNDAKLAHPYTKRKSLLSKLDKRKQTTISPENIYCIDFYDCYFEHGNFQLHLPGFSMNSFSYWDKEQPLRYVCKTRDGGKVFWVFQFDWVLRSEYPGLD
jgi:hypothetical protein